MALLQYQTLWEVRSLQFLRKKREWLMSHSMPSQCKNGQPRPSGSTVLHLAFNFWWPLPEAGRIQDARKFQGITVLLIFSEKKTMNQRCNVYSLISRWTYIPVYLYSWDIERMSILNKTSHSPLFNILSSTSSTCLKEGLCLGSSVQHHLIRSANIGGQEVGIGGRWKGAGQGDNTAA